MGSSKEYDENSKSLSLNETQYSFHNITVSIPHPPTGPMHLSKEVDFPWYCYYRDLMLKIQSKQASDLN